jgi:DNA-binding YbaB/EbfC family protein
MKNLGQMLQQAQKMQQRMNELQTELANTEVAGSSGGGMIQVTMTGKFEVRRLTIDPSLFKPEEKTVVEDLIVAALNDARSKVEAKISEKMSELTGGLPLPPGMTLPF